MNHRSEVIAARLEAGAKSLAEFAATLTETEWQTRVPRDGRKIGVVVHHAANMYPIQIQLAQLLAAGQPIKEITSVAVDTIDRDRAKKNEAVTKEAALALLASNSAAAAAATRALCDDELDRAAPLTCQSFLKDHAVRNSYLHLALIQTAVARLKAA